MRFEIENNKTLLIYLEGTWDIFDKNTEFPQIESILKKYSNIQEIKFDCSQLKAWDTSIAAFIFGLIKYSAAQHIHVDLTTLPDNLVKIIELSQAVPAKENASVKQADFVARVGIFTLQIVKSFLDILSFTGDIVVTLFKTLFGKNRFRFGEIFSVVQQCGPEALPIVTLISVLIGLILAYIGAVQLQQFGASIYVANLVGIAMLREMGPIMAAIVMAGRSGAAFAAQLGTMQVNEEVDAFKTLGISPMEMLVVPRLLALILMMPLLCVYADFLGILGGAIVGIFSLDLDPILFFQQVRGSVSFNDLFVGISKGCVFGVLIAASGCLHGIQCSRNASAVGEAVTGAVVSSIVAIVVTDAVFAVLTNILGV